MKHLSINSKGVELLNSYGLSSEDLTGCCILKYKPGEYVVRCGEALYYLLFVLSGEAKVLVNSMSGTDLLIYHYSDDGIIGDIELMTCCESAQTDVIAITEFVCIGIPISVNEKILKQNNSFLNIIGAHLANKLMKRTEGHRASALLTAEQRICASILLKERDGIYADHLTSISQSTGISYRHMLRIINKLCGEGLLEKRDGSLCIINRTVLMEKLQQ